MGLTLSRTSRHATRKHLDDTSRGKSSSSDESTDRDRMKQQEKLVKRISNSTQASSYASLCSTLRCTCPGDEKIIPKFDPMKNIMTIQQWIKRVDELAIQYEWDDRSIFKLIVSRLQGHAKDWFEWEQHNLITWAQTKTALLQHFSKKTPFATLLREAINYETKPGQNLGDYCLTKLHKIRKCELGVTEDCIVDLIIDGVKNAGIAGDIRAAGKRTTNELYNHMCTLGETPHFVKTLRLSNKYKVYDQPVEPGKIRKENVVFCYNCGKIGHRSWKCQKPKNRCTKCRRIGHTKDMCKTREANATETEGISSINGMKKCKTE